MTRDHDLLEPCHWELESCGMQLGAVHSRNFNSIAGACTGAGLCAEQVMAQLAHQIAQASPPAPGGLWGVYSPGHGGLGDTPEGLTPVLGDPTAQLALSLFSLLPWLCANFRYSPQSSVAALCLLVRLFVMLRLCCAVMS